MASLFNRPLGRSPTDLVVSQAHRRATCGRRAVAGIHDPMSGQRLGEARCGRFALRYGVNEASVLLEVGPDGQPNPAGRQRNGHHPIGGWAFGRLAPLTRLDCEWPCEVVIETDKCSLEQNLDPARRWPREHLVPDAYQRYGEAGIESHQCRHRVFDPLKSGETRHRCRHPRHLTEARAHDVDVMDRMLEECT